MNINIEYIERSLPNSICTRVHWTNEEIDAIANTLSDDLDAEITRQLETTS